MAFAAPQRNSLFPPAVWTGILIVTAILALLPILNLTFAEGSALHISSFTIALLGKFMDMIARRLERYVLRWQPRFQS